MNTNASSRPRVLIIGAGIGGLSAAARLAHAGLDVTVMERATRPGGKLATTTIAGATLDVGPTVFTMRGVFARLFADAGGQLDDFVSLTPLTTLARHSWSATERLDLFADVEQSAAAIAAFSGAAEADRYIAFCAHARRVFSALDYSFIHAPRPSLAKVIGSLLPNRPRDLWAITPFRSLWRTLGDYFRDPRLQQLFGRYATYCGGSPWLSPGTLMLVAHVEQAGVWCIAGGMHRLAEALARLATTRGAALRCGSEVREIVRTAGRVSGVVLASGEFIAADAVICNADVGALAGGWLGTAVKAAVAPVRPTQRSLSAVTLALTAQTSGFPLHRHNVFFSNDYQREFSDILTHARVPAAPTVYVCAQDRDDESADTLQNERLFCIVNAPTVDRMAKREGDMAMACEDAVFSLFERHGLHVQCDRGDVVTSTPADFAARFPGSAGALYGRAPHGWLSSFQRPGVRSRIAGLYLAGGSVHPGPGIAMASLSGQMAAAAVLQDLAWH